MTLSYLPLPPALLSLPSPSRQIMGVKYSWGYLNDKGGEVGQIQKEGGGGTLLVAHDGKLSPIIVSPSFSSTGVKMPQKCRSGNQGKKGNCRRHLLTGHKSVGAKWTKRVFCLSQYSDKPAPWKLTWEICMRKVSVFYFWQLVRGSLPIRPEVMTQWRTYKSTGTSRRTQAVVAHAYYLLNMI